MKILSILTAILVFLCALAGLIGEMFRAYNESRAMFHASSSSEIPNSSQEKPCEKAKVEDLYTSNAMQNYKEKLLENKRFKEERARHENLHCSPHIELPGPKD